MKRYAVMQANEVVCQTDERNSALEFAVNRNFRSLKEGHYAPCVVRDNVLELLGPIGYRIQEALEYGHHAQVVELLRKAQRAGYTIN